MTTKFDIGQYVQWQAYNKLMVVQISGIKIDEYGKESYRLQFISPADNLPFDCYLTDLSVEPYRGNIDDIKNDYIELEKAIELGYIEKYLTWDDKGNLKTVWCK